MNGKTIGTGENLSQSPEAWLESSTLKSSILDAETWTKDWVNSILDNNEVKTYIEYIDQFTETLEAINLLLKGRYFTLQISRSLDDNAIKNNTEALYRAVSEMLKKINDIDSDRKVISLVQKVIDSVFYNWYSWPWYCDTMEMFKLWVKYPHTIEEALKVKEKLMNSKHKKRLQKAEKERKPNIPENESTKDNAKEIIADLDFESYVKYLLKDWYNNLKVIEKLKRQIVSWDLIMEEDEHGYFDVWLQKLTIQADNTSEAIKYFEHAVRSFLGYSTEGKIISQAMRSNDELISIDTYEHMLKNEIRFRTMKPTIHREWNTITYVTSSNWFRVDINFKDNTVTYSKTRDDQWEGGYSFWRAHRIMGRLARDIEYNLLDSVD